MTALTALEIFTNPHDLSISVAQGEKNGKFGLAICRALEHNYKILIITLPCRETLDLIIAFVEELLMEAVNFGLEEQKDPESLTAALVPAGTPGVLTTDLIQAIVSKLRECQQVDTLSLVPAKAT
ncbi:MAG: hypothetical protein V4576_00115 [Patescibacteria group bacterium]